MSRHPPTHACPRDLSEVLVRTLLRISSQCSVDLDVSRNTAIAHLVQTILLTADAGRAFPNGDVGRYLQKYHASSGAAEQLYATRLREALDHGELAMGGRCCFLYRGWHRLHGFPSDEKQYRPGEPQDAASTANWQANVRRQLYLPLFL